MTEMMKWSNGGDRSGKGAFYKFYPSKETSLFEILEDMHTEIYEASAGTLKQKDANSPADRAAGAVLTACKVMTASGMPDFMERDVAFLLRKIPTEVQEGMGSLSTFVSKTLI